MGKVAWTILALGVCGLGCYAPSGPLVVSDPDPSIKIPAMKKAAREKNLAEMKDLVKALDSDDPAVRFYAIGTLERLTGQRYGYQYYVDETQREAALVLWQKWLAGQEQGVPATQPNNERQPVVTGRSGG